MNIGTLRLLLFMIFLFCSSIVYIYRILRIFNFVVMKMIFSNVPTKSSVSIVAKPQTQDSIVILQQNAEQQVGAIGEYRYAMQSSMIGRLMNSRTCKSCQK
jgi:hypothetical protein